MPIFPPTPACPSSRPRLHVCPPLHARARTHARTHPHAFADCLGRRRCFSTFLRSATRPLTSSSLRETSSIAPAGSWRAAATNYLALYEGSVARVIVSGVKQLLDRVECRRPASRGQTMAQFSFQQSRERAAALCACRTSYYCAANLVALPQSRQPFFRSSPVLESCCGDGRQRSERCGLGAAVRACRVKQEVSLPFEGCCNRP
eukprot:5546275-Pleurochrysis_carterae.AAC.1